MYRSRVLNSRLASPTTSPKKDTATKLSASIRSGDAGFAGKIDKAGVTGKVTDAGKHTGSVKKEHAAVTGKVTDPFSEKPAINV